METREIPLDRLAPHPLNCNAMAAERFEALVAHLARTGRYPPLIVRPFEGHDAGGAEGAEGYQLLDGHHRAAALRRLGRAAARCEVWDVDEPEALLLLATLNRLEGEDDPRKRGDLLAALREAHRARHAEAFDELTRRLPDRPARVARLLALREPVGPPRPPTPREEMPIAAHFFLKPADHRELHARLRALGGGREEALMALVRGATP